MSGYEAPWLRCQYGSPDDRKRYMRLLLAVIVAIVGGLPAACAERDYADEAKAAIAANELA